MYPPGRFASVGAALGRGVACVCGASVARSYTCVYPVSPGWGVDFDALDADDPFEIDDRNRPHLTKHVPFTEEDLLDAFFDDPIVVAAHEPAHFLMIAAVPGDVIVIPVMPAQRPDQVRPLGIYRAGRVHREMHQNA